MIDSYRVPLVAVIVAAFATALLPLYPYVLIAKPHRDAMIRSLDATIASLTMKVQQGEAANRNLSQFHDELRRLHDENDKLEQVVPTRLTVGTVRADLLAEATKCGVTIDAMQPRPAMARDKHLDFPYAVTIGGSLPSIVAFVNRFRTKTTVYDVPWLQVFPGGAKLQLIAFAMRERSPAATDATPARDRSSP